MSRNSPMFAHRHYVVIASIIAEAYGAGPYVEHPQRSGAVEEITNGLVRLFAADNPNFDRDRFLAAATGKPSDWRDK